MRQPHGANALIAVRMTRKAPADAVVVTDAPDIARFCRRIGFFVLLAGPGAWDFRCVHGLPVLIWCMSEAWVIDGDQLGLIESAAQAGPSKLEVWSWEQCKQFPKLFREGACP